MMLLYIKRQDMDAGRLAAAPMSKALLLLALPYQLLYLLGQGLQLLD